MDTIAKSRLKGILKAYPLFSLPNKVRGEINIFSWTNCKNWDNLEYLNTGLIFDDSKELSISQGTVKPVFENISYLFEIHIKYSWINWY